MVPQWTPLRSAHDARQDSPLIILNYRTEGCADHMTSLTFGARTASTLESLTTVVSPFQYSGWSGLEPRATLVPRFALGCLVTARWAWEGLRDLG